MPPSRTALQHAFFPTIHNPQAELRRRVELPEGYVLVGTSPVGCSRSANVFGAITGLFFLVLMTEGFSTGPFEIQINDTYRVFTGAQALFYRALLGTVPFLVVVFNLYALWAYRRVRAFVNPELLIPKHKFRRGETTAVRFRCLPKKKGPLSEPSTVIGRVIAQEVVATRQGTDTSYEARQLWRDPLPSRVVPSGETGIRTSWDITPPPTVSASRYGQDTWVVWALQVTVFNGERLIGSGQFMIDVE